MISLTRTNRSPASTRGGAETEWGVRRPDLASGVRNCGSDGDSEQFARFIAADQEKRGITGALVRRTVTYGPWEPVNDSSPVPRHGDRALV